VQSFNFLQCDLKTGIARFLLEILRNMNKAFCLNF
jgi:hypothetical protein